MASTLTNLRVYFQSSYYRTVYQFRLYVQVDFTRTRYRFFLILSLSSSSALIFFFFFMYFCGHFGSQHDYFHVFKISAHSSCFLPVSAFLNPSCCFMVGDFCVSLLFAMLNIWLFFDRFPLIKMFYLVGGCGGVCILLHL